MHPLISLTINQFITSMITGIEKILGQCRIDARHKFKFTLTMYFALIISFQIFLTKSWETETENQEEKHANRNDTG